MSKSGFGRIMDFAKSQYTPENIDKAKALNQKYNTQENRDMLSDAAKSIGNSAMAAAKSPEGQMVKQYAKEQLQQRLAIPQSQPTYSQPAPQSQPTYSQSQPTYSQSQPTYSQPQSAPQQPIKEEFNQSTTTGYPVQPQTQPQQFTNPITGIVSSAGKPRYKIIETITRLINSLSCYLSIIGSNKFFILAIIAVIALVLELVLSVIYSIKYLNKLIKFKYQKPSIYPISKL